MRVYEDGALENSTDVTNLLIDDFNISMETTGGDVSWLNINNEKHPCKRVIVDEYGTLENSTHLTNFLVDDFNISMETTGSDESWLNGNN